MELKDISNVNISVGGGDLRNPFNGIEREGTRALKNTLRDVNPFNGIERSSKLHS